MGLRITDVPGQDATRLEWWEGDFLLQQLDLDVRLPLDQLHKAEKLLNYYYGDWIFDPKSPFHKPLTKEDLADVWSTKRNPTRPYSGTYKGKN